MISLSDFINEIVITTRKNILVYCLICAFLGWVCGYGVGGFR